MIFLKLSNDLVIGPIEQMIEKVHEITKDPLKAAHDEEQRVLVEELTEGDEKALIAAKKPETNLETAMLKTTLSKVGALLALGFGEAGSQIIGDNMSRTGDINPMLPGKKQMFIFGFCDIRNFTDATEVLEEGVMLFVNEIGEIVHNVVNRFSGAANKNIGDAFLLVWKFEKEDQVYDAITDEVRVKECNRVSQLSDMALVSFVTLIAELRKARTMTKYNEHQGLNQRLKDYQVRLGLGLHLGYAIEGAIGSYYKIDASYLSPNVRMAERLEGATKHYGVPLLLSSALHQHLSKTTKDKCRQVDFCTMQGNDEPLGLYTIDVDSNQISVDSEQDLLTLKEKKMKRVYQRIARNDMRKKAFNGEIQISDQFTENKDIAAMREPFAGKEWPALY